MSSETTASHRLVSVLSREMIVELLLLLTVVILLTAFDLLAYRYGVDSREGFQHASMTAKGSSIGMLHRATDQDLAYQLRAHREPVPRRR